MNDTATVHPIPAHLKIVSVAEMRQLEEKSNETDLSYAEMMENAGHSVADAIADEFPIADEARILVLAGPGNNGGDGSRCRPPSSRNGLRSTRLSLEATHRSRTRL